MLEFMELFEGSRRSAYLIVTGLVPFASALNLIVNKIPEPLTEPGPSIT